MAGTYLIFGASGGIGGALARTLHAEGASLFLVGRDEARLGEVATETGARMAMCDVTDADALASVIPEACRDGPLAGLAFAVGSIPLKPLKSTSAAEFLDVYRLHVVAVAEALRLAEAPLKAGGGAVLLFSSVAARNGFANHTMISAAKAGVEGLAVALAAEWAPHVRVNVIAPSLTRTIMGAKVAATEVIAKAVAAAHPIPRLGEPEDMAALGAFLLGPKSGWITGQVFAVDGGRSSLRTKN